ncbi:MAG: acetyl-CoA carboxylase biotin carboxyl carrier protein [Candidatus Omnitrophica bacterium]|nr:acetyl-CoA carboxylase biotin carboxyl carrier protein [Candidatus Omnitrophota bacterium]MDD5552751.1 acetyl-CoA carboxylase biotin carboxyl carrier protein [Candidatus Omnitrophota bacterium]
MNIKEIKEMITLMNENGLMELEIEKDGTRIRLKKTGSGGESAAPGAILFEKTSLPRAQAPAAAEEAAEKPEGKSVEIKAPMVGTFYRAPSPDSPPYVESGQIIDPGQVICIIEAMKLMNEIKSEIKGKVLDILVDNTEPVEFGQPMFLIEPL